MLAKGDAKLEPYLLLAKGARGQGLVDLISRVVADPGVFTFGELLDMPSVRELRESQPQAFELLSIFAYGSWVDYVSRRESLAQLSEQQETKLKQLTVVSMAEESRLIPYARLLEALQLPSLRALEDFLIGACFYPGLLQGKLDQRRRCLVVQAAAPRDVPPGDLPQLIQGLSAWLERTREVGAALQQQSAAIAAHQVAQHTAAEAHAAQRAEALKQLQPGGQKPLRGGGALTGEREGVQLPQPGAGAPQGELRAPHSEPRGGKEGRSKRRR